MSEEKETCLKCLGHKGWVYIFDPRNEDAGSEKQRCPAGCRPLDEDPKP